MKTGFYTGQNQTLLIALLKIVYTTCLTDLLDEEIHVFLNASCVYVIL